MFELNDCNSVCCRWCFIFCSPVPCDAVDVLVLLVVVVGVRCCFVDGGADDVVAAVAVVGVVSQFAKLHPDKKQISVGVVGYPNVGKSSIINTLKKKKVRTAVINSKNSTSRFGSSGSGISGKIVVQ